MRVSEFMSEAVESIPGSATTAQARELMRRQAIRHLIVTDEGALAGVISRKDLDRAPPGALVRNALAAPLVTTTPHASMRNVANQMRGHHLDCLPVLGKDEQVVGVVTVSDLLDLIGKGFDRPAQDPGYRRGAGRARPGARLS